MLLNVLIPAAYYHQKLKPPLPQPVISFEVLRRHRFHVILSKSTMKQCCLKYPLHLFDLPPCAEAIFSTNSNNVSKKLIPDYLPAQIVHSDLDGAIVRKANALRRQFPVEIQHVKAPKLFEEIYKYFDGFDLWTEGVIFLYHVLNYIERENVQLDKEFEEMEDKEIKTWVIDWFQRTDEDLIFYTQKHIDLTTLFTPMDVLETQELTFRQNDLLQKYLEKFRRELLERLKHSRGKEHTMTEPHIHAWNGEGHYGATDHLNSTINSRGSDWGPHHHTHPTCTNDGDSPALGLPRTNFSSIANEHNGILEGVHPRPRHYHRSPSANILPSLDIVPYIPRHRTSSGNVDSPPRDVYEVINDSSVTLHYTSHPVHQWPPAEEARTAYVGGYHEQAIKSHFLKQIFSACGTVEYIKVLTGKPTAFVQFRERGAANNAIAYFNGHMMYNGEVLKVAHPNPPGDGDHRAGRSMSYHNQGGRYRASTAIHKTNLPATEPIYYLQTQDTPRRKKSWKLQNPRTNAAISSASRTSSSRKRASLSRRSSLNSCQNNNSKKTTPAGTPINRLTVQTKESCTALAQDESAPDQDAKFPDKQCTSEGRNHDSSHRRPLSKQAQTTESKQYVNQKDSGKGHAIAQLSIVPAEAGAPPSPENSKATPEENNSSLVDNRNDQAHNEMQTLKLQISETKHGNAHATSKLKFKKDEEHSQNEILLCKDDALNTNNIVTSISKNEEARIKGQELKEVSNLSRKPKIWNKRGLQQSKNGSKSNKQEALDYSKEATLATGGTEDDRSQVKQDTTLTDPAPLIEKETRPAVHPKENEQGGLGNRRPFKRKSTKSKRKKSSTSSLTELVDISPLEPPRLSSSAMSDGKSSQCIQRLKDLGEIVP